MELVLPTGPVGHIAISALLAILFRLNLPITVLCGILPDLVDKPLAAMGIGGGRYVAHSLLFAVCVSVAFFLWKRKYGLAALTGLASHLILDSDGMVPWFYPFKQYNFGHGGFSFTQWLDFYLSFSHLGYELVVTVLLGVLVLLVWWLYRRFDKRRKDEK